MSGDTRPVVRNFATIRSALALSPSPAGPAIMAMAQTRPHYYRVVSHSAVVANGDGGWLVTARSHQKSIGMTHGSFEDGQSQAGTPAEVTTRAGRSNGRHSFGSGSLFNHVPGIASRCRWGTRQPAPLICPRFAVILPIHACRVLRNGPSGPKKGQYVAPCRRSAAGCASQPLRGTGDHLLCVTHFRLSRRRHEASLGSGRGGQGANRCTDDPMNRSTSSLTLICGASLLPCPLATRFALAAAGWPSPALASLPTATKAPTPSSSAPTHARS